MVSVDAMGPVRLPVRILTAALSVSLFLLLFNLVRPDANLLLKDTLLCRLRGDSISISSLSVASLESFCSTAFVTLTRGFAGEAMVILTLA